MAVEITVERLGKPPITVRGTNIVPCEVGDLLTARSINGVRNLIAPPMLVRWAPICIDLESIREALKAIKRRSA